MVGDPDQPSLRSAVTPPCTVLAAGVASQSSGTVEALVAVDAAVSNSETAKAGGRPLVKHYRMDMKLVLVSGRWLVSQVAFAGLPQ